MKTKKIIFVATLLLCTGICQGQFLKKLGKRAERAAENAIADKVAQKTRRETSKAFDSVFNNNGKILKGKKGIPKEDYSFSHKYVLQINHSTGQNKFTYFLSKEENQLAVFQPLKHNDNVISVVDIKSKRLHSFMDMKGKKSRITYEFNTKKTLQQTITEESITIQPTGATKKILDYTCKKYIVKSKTSEGTVWVTEEAGISFPKEMYETIGKKKPENQWLSATNGLVMEMDMVDLSSKKKKKIQMLCVELKTEDIILEVAPYN